MSLAYFSDRFVQGRTIRGEVCTLVQEILLRVVAGGVAVSAFALAGDLLEPKTFAGLFGAAPSVALATLVLTIVKDGREYASLEARSMIFGAIAFFIYAVVVSRLLLRRKWRTLPVASLSITVWFIGAFALFFAMRRLVG
jgi:cbb3-type cytochrome oxidase subunit 1